MFGKLPAFRHPAPNMSPSLLPPASLLSKTLAAISRFFRSRSLAALAVLILFSAGFAQSPQIIRLDVGSSDHAQTIVTDATGATLVGGAFRSATQPIAFAVAKHNSAGALQWLSRFAGTSSQVDGSVAAVAVDSLGNVYAAGYIARQSTPTSYDIDWLVVSFDSRGGQRWADVFNSANNGYDQATALVLDPAGALYVTGISGVGNDLNWLTTKYSFDGAVQWQRTFTGASNADDRPIAAKLAPDGGVVVLGYTSNLGVGFSKDITVVKYDAQGTLVWSRLFSDTATSDEVPGGLAVDPVGNIYVTGITAASSSAEDANVPFLLKLDAAGSVLFSLKGENAGGSAIAISPDGNVVVCGTAIGEVGSFIRSSVSKFTAFGAPLWNAPLDSAGKVAVDTDGTIYVGGTRPSATTVNFFATKFASDGRKIWDQTVSNGSANDVSLDSTGSFFITGDSQPTPTDMLTVRYPRDFVPAPVATIPAAPSGLTATAGKQKLTLQWADNSNNETGFRVERAINGGAFAEIAVTAANVRTFTDPGLNKRNSYSYRVRATNGSGSSSYSNVATATPQ